MGPLFDLVLMFCPGKKGYQPSICVTIWPQPRIFEAIEKILSFFYELNNFWTVTATDIKVLGGLPHCRLHFVRQLLKLLVELFQCLVIGLNRVFQGCWDIQ